MLYRNIAVLLREQKKTKTEYARTLGVTRSTLERYLTGRNFMTSDQIEKSAKYFGVPVGRLFGEQDKGMDEETLKNALSAIREQLDVLMKSVGELKGIADTAPGPASAGESKGIADTAPGPASAGELKGIADTAPGPASAGESKVIADTAPGPASVGELKGIADTAPGPASAGELKTVAKTVQKTGTKNTEL